MDIFATLTQILNIFLLIFLFIFLIYVIWALAIYIDKNKKSK